MLDNIVRVIIFVVMKKKNTIKERRVAMTALTASQFVILSDLAGGNPWPWHGSCAFTRLVLIRRGYVTDASFGGVKVTAEGAALVNNKLGGHRT